VAKAKAQQARAMAARVPKGTMAKRRRVTSAGAATKAPKHPHASKPAAAAARGAVAVVHKGQQRGPREQRPVPVARTIPASKGRWWDNY
jgi:hypothetical protein